MILVGTKYEKARCPKENKATNNTSRNEIHVESNKVKRDINKFLD